MPAERPAHGALALVCRILALREHGNGLAVDALRRADLDQRDAGLAGEIARDRREAGRAGALHCRPQILGPRVPVGMPGNIISDSCPPDLGPGEFLEHRDDGLALRIGDRVERLVRLLDRSHLLNDRVRGIERVEAHRAFARADAVDVCAPVGMEMLGGLALHPAGEALVEP